MISIDSGVSYLSARLKSQGLAISVSSDDGGHIVRFGPPGKGFIGSITLPASLPDEETQAVSILNALLAEALQAAANEPAVRA